MPWCSLDQSQQGLILKYIRLFSISILENISVPMALMFVNLSFLFLINSYAEKTIGDFTTMYHAMRNMIYAYITKRLGFIDGLRMVQHSYADELHKAREESCVVPRSAARVAPSNVYVGQIPMDIPNNVGDCPIKESAFSMLNQHRE
jgi:hypothetical protein